MGEKQPPSFFNISETLPKYQEKNYISGIFWAFKSKLQIIHAATYIALFLPDSNNCFFNYLVPYIHICLYFVLILCFYCHLPFHTFLTTRHILEFPLLDSISLQSARNITEIKNTSSCRVKYNHGTIIRTGITCKKINCYMHDSACRWFIIKK